jgi:hypothetical protein
LHAFVVREEFKACCWKIAGWRESRQWKVRCSRCIRVLFEIQLATHTALQPLLQPAILHSGFSGAGKSNITLSLALMGICRGDAVVYIPACMERPPACGWYIRSTKVHGALCWGVGEKYTQAEYWVECARKTLYQHFDQPCSATSAFETWGDLVFQDDAIKAHKMAMIELCACKK